MTYVLKATEFLFRSLAGAMLESRQAQADREIARFLARSGGRLTDDMERRLTEHLLSRNWTVREDDCGQRGLPH